MEEGGNNDNNNNNNSRERPKEARWEEEEGESGVGSKGAGVLREGPINGAKGRWVKGSRGNIEVRACFGRRK